MTYCPPLRTTRSVTRLPAIHWLVRFTFSIIFAARKTVLVAFFSKIKKVD